MAVANDGGARRLFITQSIIGDFTLSFWLRRLTDLNDYSCYFNMGGTFGENYYIGTDGTGTALDWIVPRGPENIPGYTWTTGWQYVILVGNTLSGQNNRIRIYNENMVEQVDDSEISDIDLTTNRIELLNDVDNEGASAIIDNVKLWSAQLSESEGINEAFYHIPLRTLNLWAFWPLFNINEIGDFSSNTRNLSASGSPTTARGTPILWSPYWNSIAYQQVVLNGEPEPDPIVQQNTVQQYSFMHN